MLVVLNIQDNLVARKILYEDLLNVNMRTIYYIYIILNVVKYKIKLK